jgi:hypothetical protein
MKKVKTSFNLLAALGPIVLLKGIAALNDDWISRNSVKCNIHRIKISWVLKPFIRNIFLRLYGRTKNGFAPQRLPCVVRDLQKQVAQRNY